MNSVFSERTGKPVPIDPSQIYNPLGDTALPVFRLHIEMEGYGKDGAEIEGSNLCQQIRIAALTAEAAEDIAFNELSFGNRRPSYADVKPERN